MRTELREKSVELYDEIAGDRHYSFDFCRACSRYLPVFESNWRLSTR